MGFHGEPRLAWMEGSDMRKLPLLLAMATLSGPAMAGMMGNGGMMGGPSAAESPPPTKLDAAARKGYEFTRKYCSGCHAMPSPARHTAAEWPAVIDRMARYMRQQGRPMPDASTRESILDYLAKSNAH
jgi:hypothetical protein